MKSENYKPHPIDTSSIEVPKELAPLVEELARNIHEVWAQERISQGWVYGEHLDDKIKAHPCLVSYDRLPESEKVFDRETALSTIKMIIKLGFLITRLS